MFAPRRANSSPYFAVCPWPPEPERPHVLENVYETETKNGVFVIKIYSFAENSPKLFQKALQEFINSGNKNLVIDLRNNPGGYLDAAVSISSWFLPEGAPIVRETRKSESEKVYRSYGYNVLPKDFKFVILINMEYPWNFIFSKENFC